MSTSQGDATRDQDRIDDAARHEVAIARRRVRSLSLPVPDDWKQSDPWHVLRIQAEFLEGFASLKDVGPAISVLGSARTLETHPDYARGVRVGEELARAGFAVMTGGGPGIMAAANRGASHFGGLSVGLEVTLPYELEMNQWVNLPVTFHSFFVRKTMLVRYSQGAIVLPGGFGTLDELFEALTLLQTGMEEKFPIALLGVNYWKGIVNWLQDFALPYAAVSPDDIDRFLLTDSVAEAIGFVTA